MIASAVRIACGTAIFVVVAQMGQALGWSLVDSWLAALGVVSLAWVMVFSTIMED